MKHNEMVDLLNLIDPTAGEKFADNCTGFYRNKYPDTTLTPKEDLECAFVWYKSSEGNNYWKNLSNKLT